MTSQEALAHALEVAACKARPGEPCSDPENHHAAAILDALPEGWVVADATTGILNQMHRCGEECGAEQERKRLWRVFVPVLDLMVPNYGRDPRFAAMWDAFHPDEDDR